MFEMLLNVLNKFVLWELGLEFSIAHRTDGTDPEVRIHVLRDGCVLHIGSERKAADWAGCHLGLIQSVNKSEEIIKKIF